MHAVGGLTLSVIYVSRSGAEHREPDAFPCRLALFPRLEEHTNRSIVQCYCAAVRGWAFPHPWPWLVPTSAIAFSAGFETHILTRSGTQLIHKILTGTTIAVTLLRLASGRVSCGVSLSSSDLLGGCARRVYRDVHPSWAWPEQTTATPDYRRRLSKMQRFGEIFVS